MLQAGADMQAFLDRLALFKARGSVQLEGVQHAVGDFRISLARAVQVGCWRAGRQAGKQAVCPIFGW